MGSPADRPCRYQQASLGYPQSTPRTSKAAAATVSGTRPPVPTLRNPQSQPSSAILSLGTNSSFYSQLLAIAAVHPQHSHNSPLTAYATNDCATEEKTLADSFLAHWLKHCQLLAISETWSPHLKILTLEMRQTQDSQKETQRRHHKTANSVASDEATKCRIVPEEFRKRTASVGCDLCKA